MADTDTAPTTRPSPYCHACGKRGLLANVPPGECPYCELNRADPATVGTWNFEAPGAVATASVRKQRAAPAPDLINAPPHYTATPYEPAAVTDALHAPHRIAAALEYLARAPHKGRLLDDVRKARWEIHRAISLGESMNGHALAGVIAHAWADHYGPASHAAYQVIVALLDGDIAQAARVAAPLEDVITAQGAA